MYSIPNDLPLHHFRQPEAPIMMPLIPEYLLSNLDEIARLCNAILSNAVRRSQFCSDLNFTSEIRSIHTLKRVITKVDIPRLKLPRGTL